MATTDKKTTKGDDNIAEIGDNSGRDKELFEKAMRAQIGLNAERTALNAKISKARKGFKADGIVLKHLDSTIHMLEWSPEEIRDEFATIQRYAGWAALPVGSQVDLLVNGSDEDVARNDWRARGRQLALRMKPAEVPKGCPPEFTQDFMDAYHEAKWWS
jgi:hypothetical protein